MTWVAIVTDLAHLPHVATITTVGPAAVDVGFSTVLFVVRALTIDASERCSVAGVAAAIGIDLALQPERAGCAGAAAAVDVSFGAVFLLVRTLTTHAKVRYEIAGVADAIGVVYASLPHGAGAASSAAAVDVGFDAVFSLVHTKITHAGGAYEVADVAGASGIAATGPPEWLARAGAVAASLPTDAGNAAPTTVVGIGVGVDLATIGRVTIAILEAGIAGLDAANSLLAASRVVVGTAHIAASAAVVGIGRLVHT